VPGGTKRNLEYVEPWTEFEATLQPWQRLLLADAQTSGGLLLAVQPGEVSRRSGPWKSVIVWRPAWWPDARGRRVLLGVRLRAESG